MGGATRPSNKEMQLTRPVQVAASQLISRVVRTSLEERGRQSTHCGPAESGGPRLIRVPARRKDKLRSTLAPRAVQAT